MAVDPRPWGTLPAIGLVLASLASIMAVDYATGTELRVYPLYFLSVSLAGHTLGRRASVVTAGLAGLGWLGANRLAGLAYSHPGILLANTVTQAAAFVFVGLLIANLRDANRRAGALARVDPLTELFNRRAFTEEARKILARARRSDRALTIALMDLDHFKAVNDTHGHAAGDRVLVRVALTLIASVREGDLIGRLGGDEFAVLLPDTDQAGAAVVLERIRQRVAEGEQATGVRASIGGTTWSRPPLDVAELLRQADSRMYAAKAAGRDCVVLEQAEPELGKESVVASR